MGKRKNVGKKKWKERWKDAKEKKWSEMTKKEREEFVRLVLKIVGGVGVLLGMMVSVVAVGVFFVGLLTMAVGYKMDVVLREAAKRRKK